MIGTFERLREPNPNVKSAVAVWFKDEIQSPANLGPPTLLPPETMCIPEELGLSSRLDQAIQDRASIITIGGRRAYLESWFERARRLDRVPEERIAAAVRGMLDLSPTELTEAIAAIESERCLECGGHDPRCQCWNDE